MAQKSDDQAAPAAEAPERDSPLLDLSDAAVKRLIKTAKARGYVTYDELNKVLPSEEVTSEQIEDVMSMFSEMGINVVEQEEGEETATDEPAEDDETSRAITTQNVPVKAEARRAVRTYRRSGAHVSA